MAEKASERTGNEHKGEKTDDKNKQKANDTDKQKAKAKAGRQEPRPRARPEHPGAPNSPQKRLITKNADGLCLSALDANQQKERSHKTKQANP